MPTFPEDQNRFRVQVAQLTRTQKQVIKLFLQGQTDRAIAEELEIAESTVRQHISRIASKLKIPSDKTDKGFRRRELTLLFRKFKLDDYIVTKVSDGNKAQTPQVDSVTVKAEVVSDDALFNDPNFVGREEVIAALDELREKGAKLVQIVAPGGQGKTTLARKYLHSRFSQVIEFAIAKTTKDVSSIESLLEEKLRQIGEEAGRGLMISIERLKQKLQSKRIGILIDNLEPALNSTGCFVAEHRGYLELLCMLSDFSLHSYSIITSRELLSEPSVSLETYQLKGLILRNWVQYFQKQLITMDHKNILFTIHKSFGGNAKVMDVVSKSITQDYGGDINLYWHSNKNFLLLNPTLENLIQEQFNRLMSIGLLDEYNLLCCMGCYRYQNVPSISSDGLFCMLWNIEQKDKQKAVNNLITRGLIETDKDKKFFLHPLIREEAITRLKDMNLWQKANIAAAQYWDNHISSINTLEDVIAVFESYFHYIAIDKYAQAAGVITRMRPNQWDANEPLGRSLYRFGLLTQTITSISNILNKISPTYILGRLHNIIGDCCWMLGDIHQGLTYHKKSRLISQECLLKATSEKDKFWLNRFVRLADFNSALCYLDLWELDKSLALFERVIQRYSQTQSFTNGFYKKEKLADVYAYIAFISASLDHIVKANYFLNQSIVTMHIAEMDSWEKGYTPFLQGKTYYKLNMLPEARKMYRQALAYSQESSYLQLHAKTLSGLAEIYSEESKFDIAIKLHQKSLLLLGKIGAKCDYAEANFQLALTFKAMKDSSQSQEYFGKALYLWSPEQIDAPKQIERVRKAMNQ